MSEPSIYLGRHKTWGPTYLRKHKWDCGWYWGMGYVGNRNCHWHIDSIIHHPDRESTRYSDKWTDLSHHFESTWLNQDQWWILRDLFISAYALKKTAEVYRYGGHQTGKADQYRVTNEAMAKQLNADLETILNNIWTILHQWKEEHDNKRTDVVNLEVTEQWVDEETFFERQRQARRQGVDPVKELDRKWSEGSSPIILIRIQ